MRHARVSITIPTRNEEGNLERCLSSVFSQDYPMELLEVLVVDDDSDDGTVEVARKFPVRILSHKSRHGEIGKKIGFDASTGDLFMYMDADCAFGTPSSLTLLVEPLMNSGDLVATFTAESAEKQAAAIERYLSFDSLQRDPVFQFFSPSVESTMVERRGSYVLCRYTPERIPCSGRCLHRKGVLETLIKHEHEFRELDILVGLVKSGHDAFGFVPEAVIYHYHARSLRELVRKRFYNLNRVYLKFYENKQYRWVNVGDVRTVLRLLCWMLFANSVLGPLASGIRKSIRYRDSAGMYDVIVTPLLTNMYVLNILFCRAGRKMLIDGLRSIVSGGHA